MVDRVGYVGKDSFIVESYGLSTVPSSWEWNYDMYGKRWFTNLSEAKKVLIACIDRTIDVESTGRRNIKYC